MLISLFLKQYYVLLKIFTLLSGNKLFVNMTQASDLFDVPAELNSKPHTFIGLSGLDTLNNATHRAIWDAFSNNRRHDKVSVHYKIFPPEHVFPSAKSKVVIITNYCSSIIIFATRTF
jgi:hypothetical protein